MKHNWFVKIVGSLFLIVALGVGVYLTKNTVRFFSGASGTFANLTIDMSSDYGKSEDTWRNLAQGGESKGRMLLPVASQVRSLKPLYIRIDHVFDYYTQSQLDDVINDITQSGAKPFISLSYMPTSLAATGNVTDLPNNWADWENLVTNLIEHVSGRSGMGIEGVYYEAWNEPDLFGNFKISGSKNYLELYRHTALGVQRAQNTLPFKFGGPATTAYYPNWMKGLLEFTAKNNLRLDFLSWHKYSKNIADFEKDTAKARSLLGSYDLGGTEMIISEMGPNSENDVVYDGHLGAIHQIATSIVLQNEVSKTFTFEIVDGEGPSKYWGRWGIYTHPQWGPPEAKPRAHAIAFLNNLIGGSKLQVFGQGSWVRAMAKKISPQITRILVVNYDPGGSHTEMVPVKLTNLASRDFKFRKIDFDGDITNLEVSTSSAEWSTNFYFKPNSASIFEVITQ